MPPLGFLQHGTQDLIRRPFDALATVELIQSHRDTVLNFL